MIPPELAASRFLRAARREKADTVPVWLMRQAGRYLPEYMAVRQKVSFLELCKRPDLSAEVTLSAQQALGVDAAILFADLLPILEPMGLNLEYTKGDGPIILNPLREKSDINGLQELQDVGDLGFVIETIELVRRNLPANIPLIGFAGAPFTLASYAVEGGASRHFLRVKQLMYSNPDSWETLMQRLTSSLIRYLNAQIDAGCQAVQIFDSWAGCLSPSDYREFVVPHTRRVIKGLRPGVPVINFLTGNPALLPDMRASGGDVMGLDWRVDIGRGWEIVGHDVAIQGNLDPVSLFAETATLRRRIMAVLDSAASRPGHIFNLGHGVMPGTPVENVKALVEIVHEYGAR